MKAEITSTEIEIKICIFFNTQCKHFLEYWPGFSEPLEFHQ